MDRASEYSTVCTGIKLLNCAKKKLIGKLIVIPVYFTIIILLTKLYSFAYSFHYCSTIIIFERPIRQFQRRNSKKKKLLFYLSFRNYCWQLRTKENQPRTMVKFNFVQLQWPKEVLCIYFAVKYFILLGFRIKAILYI